ncbi:OsmC family protein [Actinoplanes sp. NPDC049118]|uniref:OsmC family protein n=1 Tax=Actinoplanes sp. NPDC049118 TaxID=3155769 RepID=UPI0033F3846A
MTSDTSGADTRVVAPQPDHLDVRYVGGEEYEITVRGHRVRVDQPTEHGGMDRAPTPTELFVASLAGCVAFYAGRYLSRHGFDREGLTVRTEFLMATNRPARVAAIRIFLHPPIGFPAERVAALVAVASGCTVHNTLQHKPQITVAVA